MTRIVKLREWLKEKWIFPMGGGFIALISLFAPSAYIINFLTSTYFWLCGLVFTEGFSLDYVLGLNFVDNPLILISSIFCSVLIFICGLTLILIANKFRISQELTEKNKRIWLISSLTLISAIIFWIIIVDVAYWIDAAHIGFWVEITPSFGVVLPFLGCFLSLMGYIRISDRVPNVYVKESKKNYYSTLVILTCFFTLILTFLILFLPIIINEQLVSLTPLYLLNTPGEGEYIAFLTIIGCILIVIIIVMILGGFLIKRKELSVGGAFFIFLPNFSRFNASMFFLYGIGIVQTIWLPLWTPSFPWLDLGDIVYLPVGYFKSLLATLKVIIGYSTDQLYVIFINMMLYFGFVIFSLGAASWFYGRMKKKEIIDFSIYKISRHPQYLGFLIWSYAFSILPRSWAHGGGSMMSSLFWVISILIVIGVALNEEINMRKKYGEEYVKYQENTPFLLPLPRVISSILNFPIRKLIKKKFPENRKEILIILTFTAGIIFLFSLPFVLIPYSASNYFG